MRFGFLVIFIKYLNEIKVKNHSKFNSFKILSSNNGLIGLMRLISIPCFLHFSMSSSSAWAVHAIIGTLGI